MLSNECWPLYLKRYRAYISRWISASRVTNKVILWLEPLVPNKMWAPHEAASHSLVIYKRAFLWVLQLSGSWFFCRLSFSGRNEYFFPFSIIFFLKTESCFPWVTLPIPLLLLSWAAGGVCTRSCARAGGIVVVLFPEGSKAPFLPWEYKFLVLSCYIYGAAVRAVGCARVCVLFGLLYFGWPQDNEEGAGGWRRQGVLGLLGCCCCRAGCWRGCLALHSSQSLCCALKVSM